MRLNLSTVILLGSVVVGCGGAPLTTTPTHGGDGGLGCGSNQPAEDGGTIMHVDIGNGVAIDASLSGNDVTLLAAPRSFTAPLHITAVNRANHPVVDRTTLLEACHAPLARNEVPTFSGTLLFNPLDEKWLESTIVRSGAGRIEQLVTAHVTNAPAIAHARINEESLAAAVNAALQSPAHEVPFTSNNWTLLCDTFSVVPGVTLDVDGTFAGAPWSAHIDFDSVALDF